MLLVVSLQKKGIRCRLSVTLPIVFVVNKAIPMKIIYLIQLICKTH